MLYYEQKNRRKGASHLSKIRNLKIDNNMKEKLEYIGLNLNDIPETITESHDLKFKVL